MGPRKRLKSSPGGNPSSSTNERPAIVKLPEKTIQFIKDNYAVKDGGIWSPNLQTVFKALASARLCAAVWNNINDCDETFNYWEPLHYLVYGSGFQTWEYSPEYALRSYSYLLLHALPTKLYGFILQSNRILVFYFLRCLLGFICTTLETYFYRGIVQEFGPKVGRLAFGFLLFSAGMFQASCAFLPSSFSMYLCLLSFGAWFQEHYAVAILATALSTFLSWPFAGVIGIGIALDLLVFKQKWKVFIGWCMISVLTILVPMIMIDSHYYGRFVIAPLNIVMYNIFSSHGPDLYGTAPLSYYLINGFLNFNVIFFIALAALPLIIVTSAFRLKPVRTSSVPLWVALLPLYLWLLIFFSQPHKEERFLYPVYPLIGVAGAIGWVCVESGLRAIKLPFKIVHWLTLTLLISSSALSVSRIVGQYKGFHAPMDLFLELNRLSWENDGGPRGYNVCVGKEWHRFPSSFFLPNNWKLLFLPSEFRGQLPRPYDPFPNGTRIIPAHMNDLNKEEPTRYSSLKDCHYIVDLETQETTEREPKFSSKPDWEVVFHLDYIDSARSNQLLRAFYIPGLSERYCKTIPYVLLKRRTPSGQGKRKRQNRSFSS